jgi:hypothetical protein
LQTAEEDKKLKAGFTPAFFIVQIIVYRANSQKKKE